MNHLTVVIIALLIPATAMAKGDCKQDRQTFCKHAPHVAACLDKHKAQLSEACKAKREAARAKAKRILGVSQEGQGRRSYRAVWSSTTH